jgi:hypothetical protein
MPSNGDPQVITIEAGVHAFTFEAHTIGRHGFCGSCLSCGSFAERQETIWFSSRYNDTLCDACAQGEARRVGELLSERESSRQDGYQDYFAGAIETARLKDDLQYAEGVCRAKQDDEIGVGPDQGSALIAAV